MELRDYIDSGIRTKGSAKALATYLGIAPQSLTNAKAHTRGIPNSAAVKLATLIGADPLAVIAASELATERQEEKRAFWFPFANHSNLAKTAGIALMFAFVTNFVTPAPAEAAPILKSSGHMIGLM
ncbi:MAG TPA: hypothetical protein VJ576_16535 [Rhodocyclaceae bacterium]|nr:hypothetical protein [Rhodocyclaceae bacterium]